MDKGGRCGHAGTDGGKEITVRGRLFEKLVALGQKAGIGLDGGQVFPVTYVGEWFDINDNTYGYERRGNTDFVITSGISDWEILFKTGTKAEYVIINIE